MLDIYENPPRNEAEEAVLKAAREELGFGVVPIDEMHRLVKEPTREIEEVFSHRLGKRVIAIAAYSETAQMHTRLMEARIPVLSAVYKPELVLLDVPDGTMPVTSLMPAISRDPQRFKAVFGEAGHLLHSLNKQGFGAPSVDIDTLLFDRLAYSTTSSTVSGVRLSLVPPYEFDPEITDDEVYDYVLTELESTFSGPDAEMLAQQVEEAYLREDGA